MNAPLRPQLTCTAAPSTRREAIRQKIMARVEIVPAPDFIPPELGPCHLWTGPTSGDGRGGDYPRMHLDGQTVAVHIVKWTNEHGFVPGKKQLDHLCKRRRCCSDLHLELVTHKENQRRRDDANGVVRKKRKRRRLAVLA